MSNINDELFDDALRFVSTEAKHWVLDAVACELHNEAGTLKGNTEASDMVWLARLMWSHYTNGHRLPGDFERALTPEEQAEWIRRAEAAWRALPRLMDRIAHRMEAHAKVFRTLERGQRLSKNEQLGAKLGRPA